MFSSSSDWQQPAEGNFNRCFHFHIRAAQLGDLTGLTEIIADGFHSYDGILGWAYPLLRLGIYEDLRNRLRSTSQFTICLVAVERVDTASENCDCGTGNELAGTVQMTLRSPEPWVSHNCSKRLRSRYPYLSNLAVCSTYRRRGVAKQLLLDCERVALSWGFQDLYLHVLENNYQARQLYSKLGYQLHQVDASWSDLLLKRPRQLFFTQTLEVYFNPVTKTSRK